jgi:hypothetical protein
MITGNPSRPGQITAARLRWQEKINFGFGIADCGFELAKSMEQCETGGRARRASRDQRTEGSSSRFQVSSSRLGHVTGCSSPYNEYRITDNILFRSPFTVYHLTNTS